MEKIFTNFAERKKKEFQVSEMTFPLTETDNIGKSTSLQREGRGEMKSSG